MNPIFKTFEYDISFSLKIDILESLILKRKEEKIFQAKRSCRKRVSIESWASP